MDIEYLYNNGKLPKRYYAQLNNKGAIYNYNMQKQHNDIDNSINEQIQNIIENIFDSLMEQINK